MGEQLMSKEICREHLFRWDSKAEELLKQYKELFIFKNKVDQAELQNLSAKVQKFYSDQMNTVLESKPWYPAEEVSRINDRLMEEALSASELLNEESISLHNVNLVRESLQGLQQKFTEENEIRMPCSYGP